MTNIWEKLEREPAGNVDLSHCFIFCALRPWMAKKSLNLLLRILYVGLLGCFWNLSPWLKKASPRDHVPAGSGSKQSRNVEQQTLRRKEAGFAPEAYTMAPSPSVPYPFLSSSSHTSWISLSPLLRPQHAASALKWYQCNAELYKDCFCEVSFFSPELCKWHLLGTR